MTALLLAMLLTGDDPALRSGVDWLLQMQQPSGRFEYGWLPAQRRPLPGDQPLRQAGAAYALARAGRELQLPAATAAAELALRALLAERPKTPPHVANPTGFAALLALALAELDAPPEDLADARGELARFLLKRQRKDGSFNVANASADPGDDPPANVPFHMPQATLALLRLHARTPSAELLSAAQRSIAWQRRWWDDHPHEAFPPWMIPALVELHAATLSPTPTLPPKRGEGVAFAFELADWCLDLQHGDDAPEAWRGGFGTYHAGRRYAAPPGITTASFLEALGPAVALARRAGDLPRAERYAQAVERGAAFLRTLQFTPERVEHFMPSARAKLVGGFQAGLDDGNLRIDQNQHALIALLAARTAAGTMKR